jgi:hypothetical protein
MIRSSLEIAAVLIAGLFLLAQQTAKTASPQKTPLHIKINTIAPRLEDVGTINGMVKAYYEVVSGPAGQPRQWDRDHTLYTPDVRFILFSEGKDGNVSAKSMTHQEFADVTDAELGGRAFYEREVHRIFHRFGNVAHVFSTAEQLASPDGPPTGHSIDSLELFWDGHRWWIASANIWPGDRAGRPMTTEFLPQ